MPLIDVRCLTCEAINEVMRPLSMYPATPECPSCGKPTEQIHLPKRVSWSVDPVIVYEAADGSYRFPGDANSLSAKRYEQQGLRRLEIRGALEMRRFEKHMNAREYRAAERKVEKQQIARAQREQHMRSKLRDDMRNMTAYGKDLARAAMAMNDRRPGPRVGDPGFYNQAYSDDRSNREESRDAQGRRRRD